MINVFRKILQGNEYIIKELETTIILSSTNNYPEDYIEVRKKENKYLILEVHRDIQKTKYETDVIDDVIVIAIILCKKMFDNIVDRMVARTIRSDIQSENEDGVRSYLIKKFGEEIVSIDIEDTSKISILKSGNKASIKFYGVYLVENASLSRAYVALYNYCSQLAYISDFYNVIKSQVGFNLSKERIQRLYILDI